MSANSTKVFPEPKIVETAANVTVVLYNSTEDSQNDCCKGGQDNRADDIRGIGLTRYQEQDEDESVCAY